MIIVNVCLALHKANEGGPAQGLSVLHNRLFLLIVGMFYYTTVLNTWLSFFRRAQNSPDFGCHGNQRYSPFIMALLDISSDIFAQILLAIPQSFSVTVNRYKVSIPIWPL